MMTPSDTPTISQVQQLLAQNGYEVSEIGSDVLRVRDLDTGVSFQAALQGNVLFLSVTLTTVPRKAVTAEIMWKMLAADNGISTSAFQLYDHDDRVAIALSNFCTLQNMGPEDHDDILSLSGYLMADLMEARELLEGSLTEASTAKVK